MSQISIIVPIYNVERHLSYCLDSLRAQTFDDIEIICINDGSTDRSALIAKEHAKLDKRLRVIDKPNGGLSSARNAGIDTAQGAYIMFVDSDDFLEKNACETIFNAFQINNADVVTFGANCIPKANCNPWLYQILSPRDAVYNSFNKDLLFSESSHPFVWRTAVRKSLLENYNIRFDENVLFGEDQVFHFELYPLAGTTVLLSNKLYNYRISRKNSLMSTFSKSTKARIPEHMRIVQAILSHWHERNLMHICPTQLMDWILDFLCFDIFSMNQSDQKIYFRALGQMLDQYFDSPIEIANNVSPAVGEVVSAVIELKKDECSNIPSKAERHYRRYRIGIRAMIRDRLRSWAHTKDGSKVDNEYLLASTLEQSICEEALTASLVLLSIETNQYKASQ